MLMPNGEAPKAGEIMKMPLLAKTFRAVAEGGVEAFYDGPIAEYAGLGCARGVLGAQSFVVVLLLLDLGVLVDLSARLER